MPKTPAKKSRSRKPPARSKSKLSDNSKVLGSSLIRAKYDAAQTTDENSRHWTNADFLSPDSALDPQVRRTLRNRARYEVSNDTYANGMIATLANDTIGTGPSLQMLTGQKELDTLIESEFYKWTVAIKLPQKLRTMRRAKAVDGEAFGSLFNNPQLRNPIRLDLRLHEAEMIASPVWDFLSESLTDGIIFDDFGNVVAYTLLKEHPGDQSGTIERDFETVRADAMIHLFNQDRPAQSRGAPEITPALPLFALRRRYSLAVLRSAELAATMSWILKTQSAPDNPESWEPLDAVELERGMGTVMPMGWEPVQMKAEQPTTQYEMYQKCIIREMARCLNMPFNVAAGDSSGYNYSSGRMDHQVYFKSIAVERSFIEATALDLLFSSWWREARLIPGLLPNSLGDSRDVPAHGWRWDGREHVDPLKEARAQQNRLESRTTTYAEEFSKQGKDWEEQFQQIAKERQLMKSLGIEFEILPQPSSDPSESVSAPEGGDA